MSRHNPIGTFTLGRFTFFTKISRVSSEPAKWDFVKIKLTSFQKLTCAKALPTAYSQVALFTLPKVFGKQNETYFSLVSK